MFYTSRHHITYIIDIRNIKSVSRMVGIVREFYLKISKYLKLKKKNPIGLEYNNNILYKLLKF